MSLNDSFFHYFDQVKIFLCEKYELYDCLMSIHLNNLCFARKSIPVIYFCIYLSIISQCVNVL